MGTVFGWRGSGLQRSGRVLPRLFFLLVMLVLPLLSGMVPQARAAAERILEFDSHLRVQDDGVLLVTETIRVLSAGDKIKRGIYRTFPTVYTDKFGNRRTVGFEVLSVERDGRPEPYHLRGRANGQAVYIGNKKVFLEPGEHTYVLTYATDHQIGFFRDYDELYWNATGTDWDFVIEAARAVVVLPSGAEALQEAAYTGPAGSQDADVVIGRDSQGNCVFSATRPLNPGEGLTVAVAWPKGFVPEPDAAQQAMRLVSDNAHSVVMVLGLFLVLGYYVIAWWWVGRDPSRGIVVPLFSPPEGFSPAAARYVLRMGFDDKAFSAALLGLAVKGALRIEEQDKTFVLSAGRSGKTAQLADDEVVLRDALRTDSSELTLSQANHSRVSRARSALKTALQQRCGRTYFAVNRPWLFGGIGLTLAVILSGLLALEGEALAGAGFLTLWLRSGTVGCVFLVRRFLQGLQTQSRGSNVGSALFTLPFVAGEIFGLVMLVVHTSVIGGLALLGLAASSVLFAWLLKAPTFAGRRLMDEIEGFRHYLSVAEQQRMELLNPPDLTPQLFERFLPYALALDVAHSWSEQFARVLERSGQEEQTWSPAWYHGSSWQHVGAGGFANAFGASFAGAVAASSVAPGSSSGSGGGGCSGGGGGGGGGGGW